MEKVSNQQIYDLIANIKGSNKKYETDILKLLRYLCYDIFAFDNEYNNNLQKRIDNIRSDLKRQRSQVKESQLSECQTQQNQLYYGYTLEKEDSIFVYLSEMLEEEKEEYLECFFSSIRPFLKMIEYKTLRKGENEPITYALNLYIMLYGYHEYKDDFATFSRIVKHSVPFFIDFSKSYSIKQYLAVKNVVPYFMENKHFQIDYIFNFFFHHIDDLEDKKIRKYQLQFIDQVLKHKEDLILEGINPGILNISAIIEKVLNSHYSPDIYYNKGLLIGNRYTYMQEKLEEVEPNQAIKDLMFECISKIDGTKILFDEGRDLYIRYMDLIFDSDTYQEVYNKVKVLENHPQEKKEKLISLLQSDECKGIIRNKKAIYEENSLIPVKKPAYIKDRMAAIYTDIYSDVVTKEEINDFFKKSFPFYMIPNFKAFISHIEAEFIRYVLNKNSEKADKAIAEYEEKTASIVSDINLGEAKDSITSSSDLKEAENQKRKGFLNRFKK